MADNNPQPPARTPSKLSQIPVRTTPGVPISRTYTPGPGARTPRGLLISAHNTPNAHANLTPHVRAAYRAIDSRRAAILTPHHARRRSLREARETPRNFLLQLGKVLAPKSERIPSSSSSPGSALSGATEGGGRNGEEEGDTSEELTFDISTRSRYGDDDDEEELPKRPRLSLGLGGGAEDEDWEDDDLPQPHRSAGLEDLTENFTVQSIELPRRVDPERDGHRMMRDSMGRLSDFPQLQQQSDGIDSGFFPPAGAIEDDEFGNAEDRIPDEFSRLDSDETRRRETIGHEGGMGLLLGAGGRDSDFHIEVPVGMDESTTTFMIASPTRQFEMVEGQAAEAAAATSGQGGGGGFAELMDRRSDSYDDDDRNDIGLTFDDYDDDGMDLDNNLDQAAGSDEEMTRLSGYTPTTAMRVSLSAAAARERLGFFREEGGEGRGGLSKIKATKKISKHGIEYTSLPPAMVKRLAQTFAKTSGAKGNISPEALKAIMQASDWFFEQLGDDLSAYAKHAHRKTIDMSDMLTLMKRQRQTNAQTTPFALAQRYLPRELLQELRMTPPVPVKKRRKATASSSRTGAGGEDEEVT
ncbi:centromere kinetochore component CENP-T-domain-containing protein [Pseudoneurospora amorphoporcata]|uniref:Centromere kinetochore component CENP-T-domain-containing protein n=1 Tax=Pseudoneurospora amorphoporcata TaxID=241081 RepID=A0AAN6SH86_9PEZI|nr:centromere kinetochore component CENP-T-domain-containing protein [Pseudoneurospora amorphoporcata]